MIKPVEPKGSVRKIGRQHNLVRQTGISGQWRQRLPPSIDFSYRRFGRGQKLVAQGLLTRYPKRMDISLSSLEEALSIRRQIDTLENRLAGLLGRTISSGSTIGKGRRRMSASSRAKIAAAARARWAKVKAGEDGAAKPRAKKGGITAAGRRRLSKLMKARWAARRKAATKAEK